jgi:glycosyltransferase involved in cell wall biosynthesis
MREPRVTFILATYNREAFLHKAFQNFREFIDPIQDEFIVIDGASTDKTMEILKQNQDLITRIISQPDRGEAHAFNKGLMIATGEIIKVLTDDDYFYPDGINKAINLMILNPDIDALLCAGKLISYIGENKEVVRLQNLPNGIQYSSSVLNMFKYAGCGLGLLFRRRIIPLVGLFDTTFLSVDSDYMARLIEHKLKFNFYRVHLFDHYSHSDSNVVKGIARIRRDHITILLRNRFYAKIITNWLNWKIRPRIPVPIRYLWKLESIQTYESDWNDGRLL